MGFFFFFFRLLFVCFLHKQHHSYVIKLKRPTKSIPTFHQLNASQLPAWAGAKVCPQTTSPPHHAHQIKCPLRGISKRRQFERGRPFKKIATWSGTNKAEQSRLLCSRSLIGPRGRPFAPIPLPSGIHHCCPLGTWEAQMKKNGTSCRVHSCVSIVSQTTSDKKKTNS